MEDGGQSRERLKLFGERHVTPTFTMSEYLEIQIYEREPASIVKLIENNSDLSKLSTLSGEPSIVKFIENQS